MTDLLPMRVFPPRLKKTHYLRVLSEMEWGTEPNPAPVGGMNEPFSNISVNEEMK